MKAYRPETNSFSSGQVLLEPYTFKKARVVIQEMAEGMALDLAGQGTENAGGTVDTAQQNEDSYEGK